MCVCCAGVVAMEVEETGMGSLTSSRSELLDLQPISAPPPLNSIQIGDAAPRGAAADLSDGMAY